MRGTWRLWVALCLLFASLAAAPASAAPGCSELITDGGFEAGGGWTLGATALTPQYVTYTRHSGNRSLALGITAGGNKKSFSSARQTVTIPASVTQATLSFWFYAQADGAPTTDYMELVLLNPSDSSILDKLWFSMNDARAWNQMSFDLYRWRGRTVDLYFNVYNDGLGGAAGMFLDDVSLVVCDGIVVTSTPPTYTPTPPTYPWTPTPTAPSPGSGCADALNNGGFESGLINWVPQGDLAGVATSNQFPHSGGLAVKLGALETSLNSFTAVRQPAVVPTGYAQVVIEAWVYTQSQPGAGADYQEIALLNGSGDVMYVPWRVVADNRVWTRVAFNITPFAGQSVYVRLGVNNDGYGGRTALYIDDVRLYGCNSMPPWATPTNTPTPWVWPPPPPSPTYWPTPPTYWPPVTPVPGCVDLVSNGGFEGGWGNWVPAPSQLPATLVTSPVLSGSYAARLGHTAYNRNTYSSVRQTVTVPWGKPRIALQFWAYTSAESLSGADKQQAVFLGAGNEVISVPWSVLRNDQTWQFHSFDLTGTPGQTIAAYFNAINDGVGGKTALFVDEVHLWACDWYSSPPQVQNAYVAPINTVPPPGATQAPQGGYNPQYLPPTASAGSTEASPALYATLPASGSDTPDLVYPTLPPLDRSAIATLEPDTALTRVAIGETPVPSAGARRPGPTVAPPGGNGASTGGLGTSTGTAVRASGTSWVASTLDRIPRGGCIAGVGLLIIILLLVLLPQVLRGRRDSDFS